MLAWLDDVNWLNALKGSDVQFERRPKPSEIFLGKSYSLFDSFCQVLINALNTLIQPITELFSVILVCRHHRIGASEGKSHCPDCGLGVVASWIILKCSGCNKRRDARLCFGQLWPFEKHCRECGAQETYCHYLNPKLGVSYPYAWLIWETEGLYLERMAGANHSSFYSTHFSTHFLSTKNKLNSKTPCQAWVEPSEKGINDFWSAANTTASNPFCMARP